MVKDNDSFLASSGSVTGGTPLPADALSSNRIYDSKAATNQLWNLKLNTEDPIAPHALKIRLLK